MELLVNKEKKSALQEQIAKSKRSVRIIKTISRALLYIGLLCGILYLVINFISPSLSMVTVNGIQQKDVSWIIISTSFILAPCLILSVCLKVLTNNLAGSNNSARVDEKLILKDDVLIYSYRYKYQSTPSERNVITINFSDIKNINFKDRTSCIEFVGDFTHDYYEDYRNDNPANTSCITLLVIHDYFEPSLKEKLVNREI